jgi:type IV pilus assembly protein PilN
MATQINLLPWREMRRKEQDRQLLSIGIGAWVLMGVIVFWAHHTVGGWIDTQHARNKFLQDEIGKLDKQIAKIRNIKKERQQLVARMNVIYKLQSDRTRMVHIMDELVRTLPQGVYYDSLVQNKDNLQLKGAAQSNARIAALLRNMEKSDWFTNPDLKVVNVVRMGNSRVSKFDLTVTQLERSKKDKSAQDQDQADAKKKPRRRRP